MNQCVCSWCLVPHWHQVPSSLSTTPDLRLTHRCVHLCVSMLNHFQDQRTMSGLLKIGSVLCLCTPVLLSVPDMLGTYTTWGHLFSRMYLWWTLCTLYLHICQVSYYRQLWSLLLYLCYVFWALINSPVFWFSYLATKFERPVLSNAKDHLRMIKLCWVYFISWRPGQ